MVLDPFLASVAYVPVGDVQIESQLIYAQSRELWTILTHSLRPTGSWQDEEIVLPLFRSQAWTHQPTTRQVLINILEQDQRARHNRFAGQWMLHESGYISLRVRVLDLQLLQVRRGHRRQW
jgi:hypothetical protein